MSRRNEPETASEGQRKGPELGPPRLKQDRIDGDKLGLALVLWDRHSQQHDPFDPYTELRIRYASNKGDGLEIFGKVNNLFESGPRATAHRSLPVGIEKFNDGVCAVLGPSTGVGVRPSFR